MRNLASVQKILNVRPIPGADMIEVVDVLGWSVVVKKNEFKVGDLAIYFEIDSFLNADDPRYATFEERFTNWGDKRGMRLKTIKLRKQISQGLVLKAEQFHEVYNHYGVLEEGQDVTELLKIEKWESLAEQSNNGGMGSKTAGSKPFPSFIRKTDQERVQNYVTELPKHADETFEVTIKLDGSSMTVFRIDRTSPHFDFAWKDIEARMLKKKGAVGRFFYNVLKTIGLKRPLEFLDGVCSRNIQLDINSDNHFSSFVRGQSILEKLSNLGLNIAIQGELIGPAIQENYEKVSEFEFFIYDVFNIDAQEYMLPKDARTVAQMLGLNYVPVLSPEMSISYFGDIQDPRSLVEGILNYAEGPGMNPGVQREGIVLKSNTTPFSFKAVSNSYLLKKDK